MQVNGYGINPQGQVVLLPESVLPAKCPFPIIGLQPGAALRGPASCHVETSLAGPGCLATMTREKQHEVMRPRRCLSVIHQIGVPTGRRLNMPVMVRRFGIHTPQEMVAST
jgi:hypothetical protein